MSDEYVKSSGAITLSTPALADNVKIGCNLALTASNSDGFERDGSLQSFHQYPGF